MDWLSTDVGKAQRNCRQLFACLILACAVALVLCQTQTETLWSERKDDTAGILLRPNKVHWKHNFKGRLSRESILRGNSNTIQLHNKEEYHKKGHGKRKKHMRNRNKSREDFVASQETARRNNLSYLQSEKKYFDYFPTEDTPEKLMPQKDDKEEEVQVVVLLLNDTDTSRLVGESPGRTHGRGRSRSRSKREIPRQETYVRENYNYLRNFLAGEQGNKGGQYYTRVTPNDPWNNRFVQPPTNFYLPTSLPYRPASVPFVKHPIPGIYHNTGTPTGNYPVVIPSLGSRFGADDDRVIWEIRYVGGATSSTASSSFVGGGNRVTGGSFPEQPRLPQTTTRAPKTTRGPEDVRTRPPPLIHRENRGRGNAGGNRQPSAQSPSNSPQVPAVFPDKSNTVEPDQRSTAAATIRRTTPRTTTTLPGQTEPSKCVWAIVSCCSPNSLSVRYSCFEQMGCHGAFWGYNPCADNLQDAAFGVAESFYEK